MLKWVNEHGKDWEIKYNDYLWEYFELHGTTPNGKALRFLPTWASDELIDIIDISDKFEES